MLVARSLVVVLAGVTVIGMWSSRRPGLAASPDTAPPLPAPTGNVVNVATESELQAAVGNISSGTTIVIAPGTYHLTSTLWVNNPVADVAIRGATNNRNDVVLVGKGMLAPDDGGVPFGIWTGGSVTRVTIANLTISDVYYHPIIFNAGTQQPWVYNVRLLDAGSQFVKSNPDTQGGGVDGGVVEYCVIEYTTMARSDYTQGVDVHTGDNWVIRHNLFRRIRSETGLAGPAILMWNDSRNTIVEGNTFIDNHRDIHLGLIQRTPNDHTGGVVRNNFFVRTPGVGGDVGIAVFDSPDTRVLHNTIWFGGEYHSSIEYRFPDTTGVVIANNLTDAPPWAREGATASLTGNAWTATASDFVSTATADLHLSSSATIAIDQVPAFADAIFDWDGHARPDGPAADIGADERFKAGVWYGGPPVPAASPVELCGDGADNDNDGQVDEECAGLGPPVHPGAPARVTAHAVGSTVTVSWLAPIVGGRVDGYVVDAGLSPGAIAVSMPLGPTTTVTVHGVGAGTYFLRVRAVGPAGSGPPSSEAAVTVSRAHR